MKKVIIPLLAFLLLFNVYLYSSNSFYFYKAVYYNFADIDDDQIFEQRLIRIENPRPWPFSGSYNKTPISPEFEKTLESLNTVAFLVIKNDSIMVEKYWDGYTESSQSNSFSVAKSFVSTLTGIALKEGKIKTLDQPVSDFLPEFKSDGKEKITIRHLLTMSSGLNWDESYSSPFSNTTEAYYGDDLKKLIATLEVSEAPGKTFRYKSGDTQILALLLEVATGKTLSENLSEKLWIPLGAEREAGWSIDRHEGMEKAYCCLYSNARDFARLGKLYLDSGNCNGSQILDNGFIREATTPHWLVDEAGKQTDYYGYQWWLIPSYKGNNIFYARGILGQYIIVIPEKRIVIVRLGKKRGERINSHFSEVYAMIDEALRF
jgi:CubicO group peptidase (beta-lactamase class C family)